MLSKAFLGKPQIRILQAAIYTKALCYNFYISSIIVGSLTYNSPSKESKQRFTHIQPPAHKELNPDK